MIANDDISFDENYLKNAMKIVNKKKNINLVSSYENKKINPFFCLNNKNGKFISENQKLQSNCFAMNAVFFKLSHLMDIGNFHVRFTSSLFSRY